MFTECKDCDALRNLVPLVQFKKREKHPWRNNCTKSNTPKSRTASREIVILDPFYTTVPLFWYFPVLRTHIAWSSPLRISSVNANISLRKLCIYSHLLKKSLMQNFNFCAVAVIANIGKYFMKIKRWYKMVYSSSKNYVSLNLWTFTYCNYQIL